MSEFVFLSNRGSAVFAAALAPLGGRAFTESDRHIDLLYFDRFGGNAPPADVSVGYQLIDRQRTIPLDNKARMAAQLIEAGVAYPRVFFDSDDVPNEPDTLWFIKDPMMTAGKGIHVVRREQIADVFQDGCIIQEAVQDLLLLEQRKFTLRAYVLVNRGQLYLFSDAIYVLHAAPYDPQSQDPHVQFEHTGYMRADSPVSMRPFAEFPQQSEVMQNLAAEMARAFAAFRNLLKYEKPQAYCLFGIDALVKMDLTTVLIEINDRPNLVHPRLVNESVNVPMLRAMYCVLEPGRAALLAAAAPRFELIAAL